MGPLLSGGFASDGFMLNLGSMLLRFCNPFTEKPEKMNKVGSFRITEQKKIFLFQNFFFGPFYIILVTNEAQRFKALKKILLISYS